MAHFKDKSTTIDIPDGFREISRTTLQPGDKYWDSVAQFWIDISPGSPNIGRKVSQVGRCVRIKAYKEKIRRRLKHYEFTISVTASRKGLVTASIKTPTFHVATMHCSIEEFRAFVAKVSPRTYVPTKISQIGQFHCHFNSEVEVDPNPYQE